MPTTRPRIMVTETDELAAALAAAAQAWPEDAPSRSRLLARLAVEGAHRLDLSFRDDVQLRIAAIDDVAGSLDGCYESGDLTRLREDWPQ